MAVIMVTRQTMTVVQLKAAGSAKTSRQVCLVLNTQLPVHATKRQNGFPGMGCQVSHALPVTQFSGSRKKTQKKSLSALHHIYPRFENAKLVLTPFMFTWRMEEKAYFYIFKIL